MGDFHRHSLLRFNRREFLKTTGTAALLFCGGISLRGCSPDSEEDYESGPDGYRKLKEEEKNYYVSRKDKLMKQYDRSSRSYKKILARDFEEVRVDKWIAEASELYEDLIPQLPYIGGDKNSFTKYIVYSSMLMPMVKIMRNEGLPERKNGQIIYDVSADIYNSIPTPIRWYLRWGYFGEKKKRQMRQAAERSQRRQYPGDWVLEFVEGDGKTYAYGLNMRECGIVKLWRSHGLEQFIPYNCLTDFAMWRTIGIEAKRTQTLANGGTHCDFRYIKKGWRGPLGWPPESNPEWNVG